MSDHADIVREALDYSKRVWDNTDDDRYCNAALAALDALVAERDEATAMNRTNVMLRKQAESRADDMITRAEAAERDLVVQHQRLLDLDETLTVEIRAAEARVTQLEARNKVQTDQLSEERRTAEAERDKALGIELSEVMDDLRAAEAERDSVILAQSAINAQNDRLREALTFYRDADAVELACDEGNTARAALGEDV